MAGDSRLRRSPMRVAKRANGLLAQRSEPQRPHGVQSGSVLDGLCPNGHMLSALKVRPQEYHDAYIMRCEGCAVVINEALLGTTSGLHCPKGCGYDLCGECADFARSGHNLDGRPSSPECCASPAAFVRLETPAQARAHGRLTAEEQDKYDDVIRHSRRQKAEFGSPLSRRSSPDASPMFNRNSFDDFFGGTTNESGRSPAGKSKVSDRVVHKPRRIIKVDEAEYMAQVDDSNTWCQEQLCKMRHFLFETETAPKFRVLLHGEERPTREPSPVRRRTAESSSPSRVAVCADEKPLPSDGCGVLEPPTRWRSRLATAVEHPARSQRRTGMSASSTTASLLRTRKQNITALKMIERRASADFFNTFALGPAPSPGEESDEDAEAGERARSSARAMLRLLREQRCSTEACGVAGAEIGSSSGSGTAVQAVEAAPLDSRPGSALSFGGSHAARPSSAALAAGGSTTLRSVAAPSPCRSAREDSGRPEGSATPNRPASVASGRCNQPLSARGPQAEPAALRPASAACALRRVVQPLSARGSRDATPSSCRPGSAACAPSRPCQPLSARGAKDEPWRSRPDSAIGTPSPAALSNVDSVQHASGASGWPGQDLKRGFEPRAPVTARPANLGRKVVITPKTTAPMSQGIGAVRGISSRSMSARRQR